MTRTILKSFRLLLLALGIITAAQLSAAVASLHRLTRADADNWTNVTDRFIANPDFSTTDGWTWDTNSGTVGIGSGNMRIYSGWFDFHQTLSKLPKGHYRLSVQAFYRDGSNDNAYNAHLNGTESLAAYLYAGSYTQQVVSIYSEALGYNAAGRCWTPDGVSYYPDGRDAAGMAIDEGMYWNTLEFDTQGGSLNIGLRCDESTNANYCVIDNFRLEYQGELPDDTQPDDDGWVDVTSFLLQNPGFDNNSGDGWTWECNARSQQRTYDAMEFWYGTFNIWQTLEGLPSGKYRLSVQAYYRTSNNNTGYANYQNGTEEITAYMYAGDTQQPLVSVYSYEMPGYVNGCWSYNSGGWFGTTVYFPNTMESGTAAFAQGAYMNTMEFQASGSINIGLRNDNYAADNWCLFDNFKLEYQGTIVKAASVTATIAEPDLIVGQQTTVSATVLPANALSKKVVWTSSDESVATVTDDGIVTAVWTGTAQITATAVDGSGKSASVTVRVTNNPPTAASLVINEIMAANVDEFISPAFNFDAWVEFYNPSDKEVSLIGCYLSNDGQNMRKWRMPVAAGTVPAHGYKVVWFDSNKLAPQNAPFKLDVDGGTIYVCDPDGRLIAQQAYPSAMERISYARTTDGGSTWSMATLATPGKSNATTTYATEQLEAPVVNQPSKFFTGTTSFKVTIPSGCTLRYTTDGTLPTLTHGTTNTSGRFSGVTSTLNYRFRLFADGMLPSPVTTRSFIKRDKEYSLPVVSVVADPDFLYSSEMGVMAKGPNGRPGNGSDDNCNWNMDWERPVNLSYLDASGKMVLNQDVNLEMCGGWSRGWTPHSFKLKGNKELGGVKYLPYTFFAQKPYIRNRTLQIRNGGNDTGCRFIDASLQYIVETSGFDLDCQSYQPVHEFINGSYIGVLNVREPNNKHYVEANYGWDDTEIDQFEMSPDSGYVQMCGTDEVFRHLVDDLSPNAADAATYAEIGQLLDIGEYANYMAVQLYLGGTDWPQNNVKGFRHRNDGKFRFVLFDLDFAFNTNDPFNTFMNKEYYTFDPLRPASLGRLYNEHIRFVTLFKNLLKNASFRKQFVDAFCIVGGSVFEASRSKEIADMLEANVAPAMSISGESPSGSANKVRNQLAWRLNTSINALRNYGPMKLSGVSSMEVTLASNVEDARLLLNGQDVPTARFAGTVFEPAVVKATAPEGYAFKGWQNASGTVVSNSEECDLFALGEAKLTAVYEAAPTDEQLLAGLAMPVKVNEVNAAGTVYVSETWKSSDWIELYNTTDTDLDACGLYLSDDSDEPLKYQITQHAVIPAKGHLVVWADGLGGTALGEQLQQVHTNFKLSNSDGQHVIVMSSDAFVANNAGYFKSHPAMKTFVDGLAYVGHNGEQSVGRYPDGGRSFYVMNHPTIERTNTVAPDALPYKHDQSYMGLLPGYFNLHLAQGWTWVSHPLADPIGTTALSPYVARVVGQKQEAFADTRLGMVGTLASLEAGQMYKVQMSSADNFASDAPYCRSSLPVMLLPGWNWIGYTVSGTQTVQQALTAFTADEGDQLLGQDGFATYKNGQWTGSLTSFETGKGYMLYSRQAKTLTFAKPALALNPSLARAKGKTARLYGVDKHAYPNVMGVVGTLLLEGEPVAPERFTLLAYAGDECRGAAKWVDGQLYLTTYGQGGEQLLFVAIDNADGSAYSVAQTMTFSPGIEGTPQSPQPFTIGEPTAIATLAAASRAAAVEGYYSLSGMRLGHRAAALAPGIYIVKHQDGSCRKVYIK